MSKMYSTNKQILNEMKRMLKEEATIKYKDDNGEQQEMPADSAKKLPDSHPAKQKWRMTIGKKSQDDSSGEKVKGADLFKSKEDEPKSYIKYTDREEAYDAAEEAVEDILGDLGGTPIEDMVKQHADDLRSYLNSDDPDAKRYIEDVIVDNQVTISREQVNDLNKAFYDNGIDHKVEYDRLEREQDHDTRPKSPFYNETAQRIISRRLR